MTASNIPKRKFPYHEVRVHLRAIKDEITHQEWLRLKQMSRSNQDDDRELAISLILEFRRKQLASLLDQCSEHNREVFRRMYWYAASGVRDLKAPPTTKEMADGVSIDKLSWAIQQCINTLNK